MVEEQLAEFMLKVARPMLWHDPALFFPKTLNGGTCFFLKFEQAIIGLTANHVIQAFERAIAANPNIICQLGVSARFDLLQAVIDRDEERDIASFRVTPGLLSQIEAIALDCRENWPPPEPSISHAVSICGFPEISRLSRPNKSAELLAWGTLAAIESISEREIVVTFDPERDRPTTLAPMPSLGFNLSGCSGGPMILHGLRNGLQRWFAVGLVIRGPSGVGTGDSAKFDIIRCTRIHVVNPDGSIQRDQSGWLPTYG
jgi:hypothetical protein